MHRLCVMVIVAARGCGGFERRRSTRHGGDRQLALPAARSGGRGPAEADRRSVHDSGRIAGGLLGRVRQTPGHRPGGGRGTQPRAAGRRLAEPVSLQGGERGARPWTAPSRRVHGRLDHRQLGTRRSGALRRRHRRSWHRRPDVAADAGAVPAGRRRAATARRAHHGRHQRHRRQYRSDDARGLTSTTSWR